MEVATDVSLWRYQTGARSPYCLRVTSFWWVQFLSLPCGILLLYSLAACTHPLFPPDVTKALDPSLQMDIFNPEAETYLTNHLIQVGGRISDVEKTVDGSMITVEALPLNKSRTMVIESAPSTGSFVLQYSQHLDPSALERGNKLIVVGVLTDSSTVTPPSARKPLPLVMARCLHVWKTGRYEVRDFPHLPTGYYTLRHQTYCLNSSLDPASAFDKASVQSTGAVSHGIATGDVTSDAAVLWFRTDGPAQVEVHFAAVDDWERASRLKTDRFSTNAAQDFTMQVQLAGLRPATHYRYVVQTIPPQPSTDSTRRFTQGEFMTAPAVSQSMPITFAWSADLGGQQRCRDDGAGYPIFERLQSQHLDFMILLGDLIYGDDRCPSPPNATGNEFTASTLSQYRTKHRYQHGSSALQQFLASVPIWAMWDDHDVTNNFSGPYEPRMPLGRQALFEYWPIRHASDDPTRLYRHVRYGTDLEIFLLDTRQYRSRNSDLDGANKTMLGTTQLAWLINGLAQSTATWKVIATSVPLSTPKPGSVMSPGNDSWTRGADGTGFQHELRLIVQTILSHPIRNVVWLAADVHYMQANAYDVNRDGVNDFHEFIAGPLSGASKTPLLPDSTFHPTTLFNESGSLNFGEISIHGTVLEVTIIDESGRTRFSHQLMAQ
ncbi:MAG: alkaline phosphatase D family protein [Nitrospira sp.]|nr:alkaline phosphatase D family protein [Nitrospira sp.]